MRKSTEIFINAYNPDILEMHNGIQFILDAYACVGYIINYINKTHSGVSELLHQAYDNFKNPNDQVKERFKIISNIFLNITYFLY